MVRALRAVALALVGVVAADESDSIFGRPAEVVGVLYDKAVQSFSQLSQMSHAAFDDEFPHSEEKNHTDGHHGWQGHHDWHGHHGGHGHHNWMRARMQEMHRCHHACDTNSTCHQLCPDPLAPMLKGCSELPAIKDCHAKCSVTADCDQCPRFSSEWMNNKFARNPERAIHMAEKKCPLFEKVHACHKACPHGAHECHWKCPKPFDCDHDKKLDGHHGHQDGEEHHGHHGDHDQKHKGHHGHQDGEEHQGHHGHHGHHGHEEHAEEEHHGDHEDGEHHGHHHGHHGHEDHEQEKESVSDDFIHI
ncbi:unnamed protein product [Polarella glacialis]|uniref:Uncharacterized protein n=1 Tax=Polarella glacialis TaxID=89957 RepID=A0A813JUU1_POLGL|nr:unnamed protein product [Polarella glacialis]